MDDSSMILIRDRDDESESGLLQETVNDVPEIPKEGSTSPIDPQ